MYNLDGNLSSLKLNYLNIKKRKNNLNQQPNTEHVMKSLVSMINKQVYVPYCVTKTLDS